LIELCYLQAADRVATDADFDLVLVMIVCHLLRRIFILKNVFVQYIFRNKNMNFAKLNAYLLIAITARTAARNRKFGLFSMAVGSARRLIVFSSVS